MVKSSMLESVRAVTGGAAPFGPALIENFKKKCEPHEVEFREGKINSISLPIIPLVFVTKYLVLTKVHYHFCL